MAFYNTYEESRQNNLARDAQTIQAMQAFANFMQKNKENQAQAGLQGAQAEYYNQQMQGEQMKNDYMRQFLAKQNGGMQQQMQSPQMGSPRIEMMSQTPGGIKTLSPHELARQNQMGQQSPQTAQSSVQSYSLADIQEPEVNPFTNKLTANGERQDAQNKLIMKQLESEQKQAVPSAKMKEDLMSVNNQIALLDSLESQAKKIPGGWAGIGNSLVGIVTRGEDWNGVGLKNVDETKLYNANKPAMAVSIYRALTGDTRLSDADAKARALPLLWDVSEGESIKKKKFAFIKEALMKRKQMISNGKYTVDADGQFVTPLSSLLGESEDSLESDQLQSLADRKGVTLEWN
jgi:hypothetical protein